MVDEQTELICSVRSRRLICGACVFFDAAGVVVVHRYLLRDAVQTFAAESQQWAGSDWLEFQHQHVASRSLPAYLPHMSTIEQIRRLPLQDKLLVMEALWDDLSRHSREVEVPQWHKDVLDERERLLNAGEARFIDWEVARQEIEAAIA